MADRFGIEFKVFPIDSKNKADGSPGDGTACPPSNRFHRSRPLHAGVEPTNSLPIIQEESSTSTIRFLPAFPGAKPYHSASKRGSRSSAPPSHYVSSELDAGPIIEQDVVRVSHADSIPDLIRKGRDLEKVVLSRAIWLHLGRKILARDSRTLRFWSQQYCGSI
ncbi:MAG: hypothetical protein MZU84_02165 [Sphingobacterium sp.]|nr:hypothetical protein [Sphingobacterium sp.]